MERLERECSPDVRVVAIVSPNNPTGLAIAPDELRRIARGAPDALILVDLAYAEYADSDLTGTALELPNCVVVRTLSKAWGLAGLRVGYAAGDARMIGSLRVAGGPYTVSGPSIAIASAWIRGGDAAVRAHVDRVRAERVELAELLTSLGAETWPSQANFVLARVPDATGTHAAMALEGIAVRAFPRSTRISDCIRITCPGSEAEFARLCAVIGRVLSRSARA